MTDKNEQPERVTLQEVSGGEWLGHAAVAARLGVSVGQLQAYTSEKKLGGKIDPRGSVMGPDGRRRRPISAPATLLPEPAEVVERSGWRASDIEKIAEEFEQVVSKSRRRRHD